MFNTLFYQPLYNLVAFVITFVPLHDIGVTIIIVTLIVKFLLYPIQMSATKSSHTMRKIEHKVKALRETHKDSPETLGRNMMELYKEHDIRPFASILGVFIQIPILLALYQVFSKGFIKDESMLYSFVSYPESLHTLAFGIIDVTKMSIVLAVLTGVTAYILAKEQVKHMPAKKEGDTSFGAQFQDSLKTQMIYVFPVFFTGITMFLPSALGIYWVTSNVISLLQYKHIIKKLG